MRKACGQGIKLGLLLAGALALSGCATFNSGKGDKRVYYDGVAFKPKVSSSKEDRENFEVRVKKATQTLTGAREAGRHKAIAYCIEQYGNSDIIWTDGPDAEDGALILDGDTLVMRGRCLGW